MAFPQAGVLITADVSQYTKAMQRVESVTSSTLGRVNGALGAFGVALSAASAVAFTKSIIDAADSLNDLEKRTGISVERLSAWRLATEQSGTSMDALAGALGKASKYMVEHGDNLKAIGITGKTAEETMIQLAGVISSLPADDPRRVALAMEVLGKSAGELLPLLAEGAAGLRKMLERGQEINPVTSDFARRAAELNDQLAEMKVISGNLGVVLGEKMVPELSETTKQVTRLAEEGNVLGAVLRGIAGLGKSIFWDQILPTKKYSMEGQIDELKSSLKVLVDAKKSGGTAFLLKSKNEVDSEIRVLTNQIEALEKLANKNKNPLDAAYAKYGQPSVGKVENKALDALLARSDKKSSRSTTEKISDYQRLTQEVLKFTSAQQNEASGAEKLTQGQTMALGIMTKIQAGTLKLSESEKIRLGGMLETALTIEKLNDTEAEADKRRHAAAEKHIADFKAQQEALAAYENDWTQHLGSLEQNLKSLEEQNQLYGLTAEQIAAVNVQRAQEAVDIARTNGVSDDYIARLERELELRKGILTKTGELEQKQQWTSIFGSIENTAHDTFISIFDSGKSAFDRLRDTLKNGLLDLLYQMTIKKWILNISAAITGTSAAGSALAAGGEMAGIPTGGGLGIGSLGSVFDVVTKGFDKANGVFLGGIEKFGTMLQTWGGPGSMLGGAGNWITQNSGLLGSASAFISPVLSLLQGDIKGAVSQGVGAGLGTMVGGPVGGMIGSALGGVIGGLFGKSDPHPYASTAAGMDNAGNFYAGGIKAKHLTGTEQQAGMAPILSALVSTIKDLGGSINGKVWITQDHDSRAATSYFAGVNNLKKFAASDSDQAALAGAVAAAYLDNIKSAAVTLPKYLKTLADSMAIDPKTAQSNIAMLQQLKATYDGLTGMNEAISVKLRGILDQGLTVNEVAGFQSLSQAAATYYSTFYSEADQLASATKAMNTAFAALNLTVPAGKKEFIALVDSIDTTTKSGAGLYAALMQIAPGFAQIQDAAKAAAQEAEQSRLQSISDAESALRSAWQSEQSRLQGLIGTFREFGKSLLAFKDNLLLGNLSTLSPEQQYLQAASVFRSTYASAQMGDLTALGNLQQVITDFLNTSQSYNASNEQYAADFNEVQSALSLSAATANRQADISAQQLAALDSQVSQLITINQSVLSVEAAIKALQSARGVTAGSSTSVTALGTDPIGNLYQSLLGRGVDPTGAAGWGDMLAKGASIDQIRAGIMGSQEYLSTHSHANGGVASGWSMVGERGAELVNFSNPARVYTADQTKQILGSDNSVLEAKLDAVITELRALVSQGGAVGNGVISKLDDVKTELSGTRREIRRAA